MLINKSAISELKKAKDNIEEAPIPTITAVKEQKKLMAVKDSNQQVAEKPVVKAAEAEAATGVEIKPEPAQAVTKVEKSEAVTEAEVKPESGQAVTKVDKSESGPAPKAPAPDTAKNISETKEEVKPAPSPAKRLEVSETKEAAPKQTAEDAVKKRKEMLA